MWWLITSFFFLFSTHTKRWRLQIQLYYGNLSVLKLEVYKLDLQVGIGRIWLQFHIEVLTVSCDRSVHGNNLAQLVQRLGNLIHWIEIHHSLNNQGCIHFGYGARYSVILTSDNLFLLQELQRNNLDEDSIINLKELRGVFKNVSKETSLNTSFQIRLKQIGISKRGTSSLASFSVSQAERNRDVPEPLQSVFTLLWRKSFTLQKWLTVS